MKINRVELLKQLESVLPGLSTREIIEQSSCFIFKDKTVSTFNDEISCSQKTRLRIEGAVRAMPLIQTLRKMKEEELDIDTNKKSTQLIIKGKNERAGINMEQNIILPIEGVDKPKKWKELPANFADAIAIVQPCAGKNESEFTMTCIHINSKWIEASDVYQAARYKIKTDISKPTLIRKESLKYILTLDMTKFSEAENWIHFKNPTGLIFSCRHCIAEIDDDDESEGYPTKDIARILKVKGEPLTLPKGLKKAIEKAEIFSTENIEGDDVIVDLNPGKFRANEKQVTYPIAVLVDYINIANHPKCLLQAKDLKRY